MSGARLIHHLSTRIWQIDQLTPSECVTNSPLHLAYPALRKFANTLRKPLFSYRPQIIAIDNATPTMDKLQSVY